MVNAMKNSTALALLCLCLYSNFADSHQHQVATEQVNDKKAQCNNSDIICAKTVTSAFAPNGDLWRLWSHQEQMYFQFSHDLGKHFSPANLVDIAKEKISARNENRPKIAFDKFNGVYLSWATPRAKRYTADVRFSYSADYGKSFSTPITVNNDHLLTGHSFNELHVNDDGEVSIVWLDGRLSYQLRKQGKESNGSALYLAQSTYNKSSGKFNFSNTQLANNTCVCCRIAIDINKDNQLAIFWRHIYGDNIREFALLTLDRSSQKQSEVKRISNDHWKINGCPHQGGGISIDKHNRYHLTWFNQGSKGKGIFYAFSDDQGKSTSTPLAIGNSTQQAAHPNILSNGNIVDIVWQQFNGTKHQLWHQKSIDFGKTFTAATQLAQTKNSADRAFIIKKDKKSYVSWHRPKQGHWFQAL